MDVVINERFQTFNGVGVEREEKLVFTYLFACIKEGILDLIMLQLAPRPKPALFAQVFHILPNKEYLF